MTPKVERRGRGKQKIAEKLHLELGTKLIQMYHPKKFRRSRSPVHLTITQFFIRFNRKLLIVYLVS